MDSIKELIEPMNSITNMNKSEKNTTEDEGILIIEKKNNNFGPGSARSKKKWTVIEDKLLLEIVSSKKSKKKWKEISGFFKNKTAIQCRSRWERIKPGIKSGRWTKEEDELLQQLHNLYGLKWSFIARRMNNRTGKQIRERCKILLDRKNKREKMNKDDKLKLIKLYNELGPNWILIKPYFNNKYNAETLKNAFYAYYRRKEKYGQVVIKYPNEIENKESFNLSSASEDENKDGNRLINNGINISTSGESEPNSKGNYDIIMSNNTERKETVQSSECVSTVNSRKEDKAESLPHMQYNNSISSDYSSFIRGIQSNFLNNPRIYEELRYFQSYYSLQMQKLNILNNFNNYVQSASMLNNYNNLNAIIQRCMAMSLYARNSSSLSNK